MTCERCGHPFRCTPTDENCWCKSLPTLNSIPTQYKNCLCPECLKILASSPIVNGPNGLIEGEDFYYDKNKFVFTAKYHLDKGYCCNSGCRHCPYSE